MSYINTSTLQYPITEQEILALYPNVSFPVPFVAPEPFVQVFPAPQPTYDPVRKFIREVTPVITIKGHYEQVWEVIDIEPEQIVINEAKKAEQDNKTIADKIESLWAAANAYTTGFISGVAIGILTIGVLQGKPKSLAVSAWSKVIWDEYYIRKAGITVDSNLNLDFSSFGPIPYTIPELSEEAIS